MDGFVVSLKWEKCKTVTPKTTLIFFFFKWTRKKICHLLQTQPNQERVKQGPEAESLALGWILILAWQFCIQLFSSWALIPLSFMVQTIKWVYWKPQSTPKCNRVSFWTTKSVQLLLTWWLSGDTEGSSYNPALCPFVDLCSSYCISKYERFAKCSFSQITLEDCLLIIEKKV